MDTVGAQFLSDPLGKFGLVTRYLVHSQQVLKGDITSFYSTVICDLLQIPPGSDFHRIFPFGLFLLWSPLS